MVLSSLSRFVLSHSALENFTKIRLIFQSFEEIHIVWRALWNNSGNPKLCSTHALLFPEKLQIECLALGYRPRE